jgi:hypothetical protein
MSRALGPVVVVFLLFGAACAHEVSFKSEPPGADVFVDGEHVGQTPVIWTEESSTNGRVTVEVRSGTTEARFAVRRDGFAPLPIVTSIVGAAASMAVGLLLAVPGYMVFLVSLVAAPAAPAALGVAVVGLSAFVLGSVLAGVAWEIPFLVLSEGGRVSPDEVYVDFHSGEIVPSSGDGVEDLVGVTPGHTPLRAPRP